MAVAFIKLSLYYIGDRRPAIVGVSAGPERGVVVVVVVVIVALKA